MFLLCVPPAEYNLNLCPAGSWKCVFPSFIVQIGLQQYCFLVFLVISSLTATYIFFIIPETKNKTFLEIQNEFRSSRKNNSCHTDGVSTTLIATSMWLCIVSGPGMDFLCLFHNHECIQQVSELHSYKCFSFSTDKVFLLTGFYNFIFQQLLTNPKTLSWYFSFWEHMFYMNEYLFINVVYFIYDVLFSYCLRKAQVE